MKTNPLETLEKYKGFKNDIKDKKVCDFGCGAGEQVFEMSKYAREVMGFDKSSKYTPPLNKWPANAWFSTDLKDLTPDFDVVISLNSMEHFENPGLVISKMRDILKPGGCLYITFGPPWYAPYGAHMMLYTKFPWIHMVLPECLVMRMRNEHRPNDRVEHYHEIEGGLNKMTIKKFEQLIKESGMALIYKRYDGVKGLNFLTKIPGIREFFINHVSVILFKAE